MKLLYGVAINDIKGDSQSTAYRKWVAMLNRCYNPKELERKQSYQDCYVCDEWLTYSNFKKWFENHYIDGFELDKDLLVEGNKVYSPDTCIFIPHELNALYRLNTKPTKYARGVSWDKNKQLFQATISIRNKNKGLGRFPTEQLAAEAYIKTRAEYEKEVLLSIKEKYTNESLIALVNKLLTKIA